MVFVMKSAVIADLKSLSSTHTLSNEAIQILASVATRRKFVQGDAIWETGDPCDYFAIIVTGLVEGSRTTATKNPNETTLAIFGPGDVIGLPAVIRKTTYPGNARAFSKSIEVIKFFMRPILQSDAHGITDIHAWIRQMLLVHDQLLLDKIDILNAGSADSRIYVLLNQLLRRFGNTDALGKSFIPLRFTRAECGRMIGIRVETVIRIIGAWQKKKLLQWSSKGILIECMDDLEHELNLAK